MLLTGGEEGGHTLVSKDGVVHVRPPQVAWMPLCPQGVASPTGALPIISAVYSQGSPPGRPCALGLPFMVPSYRLCKVPG